MFSKQMRSSAILAIGLIIFIFSCSSTGNNVSNNDLALLGSDNSILNFLDQYQALDPNSFNTKENPIDFEVNIGHSDEVTLVDVSPDGNLLLTSGNDVKIWEVSTGKVLRTIEDANMAKFSPFGNSYLTGRNYSETAELRDLESGEIIQTYGTHDYSIEYLEFAPDGRSILTASDADGVVKRFETSTGRLLQEYKTIYDDGLLDVQFSPEGDLILVASRFDIYIFALDGTLLFDTPYTDNFLSAVRFTTQGNGIFVAEEDGKLYHINFNDPDLPLINTFKAHDNEITSIQFDQDMRRMITSDTEGTIRLWWIFNLREYEEIQAHDLPVYSITFNSDGARFFTGSGDLTAKLWDFSNASLIQEYGGVSTGILNHSKSPDGNSFATLYFDDSIKIWNSDFTRIEQVLYGHEASVNDFYFSSDSQYLFSSDTDGSIIQWNLESGQINNQYNDTSPLSTMALSPNDRLIAVKNYSGQVKVLDSETFKEILRIPEDHTAFDLSFSLDSSKLIVAGYEFGDELVGYVRLWDLNTQQLLVERFYGDEIVFNADLISNDQYILSSSSKQVFLIDVASGEQINSFTESMGNTRYSLSYDRNQVTFIRGNGKDNPVENIVYDLESSEILLQFLALDGNLYLDQEKQQYYLINSSGIIETWDFNTANQLVERISSFENEILTWTPEGYFSGDQELARSAVYFVNGFETTSIDQLFSQYYRPDIVNAKQAGEDIRNLVANRSAQDLLLPLPELTIELKLPNGSFRPIQGSQIANLSNLGFQNSEGIVELRVTAEDTGGGVQDLRFFHNGVRIQSTNRGLVIVPTNLAGETTSVDFRIQLIDGANQLTALALNSVEIESQPSISIIQYQAPRRVEPELWILAIGVNDYKNGRYNLNYAVSDSEAFVAALEQTGERLFSRINSQIIQNSDATRTRVTQAIGQIARQAKPEDVFIFFYAGHGIALDPELDGSTDFFFVPHDVTQMTDINQINQLAISGVEFENLVSQVPALKQFLILDACNSGAINSAFGARGVAEEVALSRLSRATGSALIAASRDDQFAQEFAALGQGALTQALLNGLLGEAANSDGFITVAGLKSYVDSVLPDLTREYAGLEQYPTGFIFGQDFPIGIQ
jgi:WD40 repeat protein